MADSAFKTQISRDENANTASNVVFIQIADNGGNAVTVTGNKLDVNATVTLETAYVDDSAFAIGVDKVNAQGFLADETATDSVDEGDIGIARMTLDRRMIVAADQNGSWTVAVSAVSGTVAVTQSGTWNIATVTTLTGITNDVNIADGGNSITVDAVNLDIRDLTHVSDSVSIGDGTTLADVLDGTIDALYVAITDGTNVVAPNADGSVNVVFGVGGTRVHKYATATPGAGASSNNDYTVVGSTFELQRVSWGGSGKMKVEIQSGPVGALVTKAVGFSEKDITNSIEFNPALSVPVASTGTVRVIMTNRQGAAVDVYSTIMGVDKA